MSDFFLRLAARSLDSTPVALPRIASRYATPSWDRSPQVDTQFAAGAASERPPPAPVAVAARSHEDGEVVDASPPPTSMRHDGPATSSPECTRTSSPSMPRTRRKSRSSHTGIGRGVIRLTRRGGHYESGREAAAIDPSDRGSSPCAATAIRADQLDRSPEAYGPVASTRTPAPTAPAHASRPRDDAKNASGDIARVTPPNER